MKKGFLVAILYLASYPVLAVSDSELKGAVRSKWDRDPQMPNFIPFKFIGQVLRGNEPEGSSHEDFVYYQINVVPHVIQEGDTDDPGDIGIIAQRVADPPIVTRKEVRKLIKALAKDTKKVYRRIRETRRAMLCSESSMSDDEIYEMYDLIADVKDAAWIDAYYAVRSEAPSHVREALDSWLQRQKLGMTSTKYSYKKYYEVMNWNVQNNRDGICGGFNN